MRTKGDDIGSRQLTPRQFIWAASIILSLGVASCKPLIPADGELHSKTASVSLKSSVREDGTATPLWTRGIGIAIGDDMATKLAKDVLPLTPEADAWWRILQDALPLVTRRANETAILFDVPPLDAIVVVGNRGSSDGFGWAPNHIGINVQAFANSYGTPGVNAIDRMVRIATHEYMHLLTYAYYQNHRELRQTPFDRALWTMYFEGIGDYLSVSPRWLPDEQGNYSLVTINTLKRLEPIFVERLERLATADDDLEKELRIGISMGKFDEKWGSLPVALWLHSEVKRCGELNTLQAIFRLERGGVLSLALRNIAPEFKPRIKTLRDKLAGNSYGVGDQSLACLAHRENVRSLAKL